MLYYKDDFVQIHHDNALEVLRELPSESVQCVITSPPYWGLRNYAGGSDIVWGDDHCEHKWVEESQGLQHENRNFAMSTQEEVVSTKATTFIQKYDRLPAVTCIKCGAWRGQLGLEPTPELYVEHLMMIFSEIKRVLKKDGSFYLNIGDTYVSGKGSCFNPGGGLKSWQSWNDRKENYPTGRDAPNRMCKTIPPKCMACIPERVLFAMLEDGWILRNKIIWHKRNHMPGSQKDRFTQSWEYLYFFTKSRKYYFDLDAVRVPHKTQSLERYQRGVNLGRPAEGKSGVVGPMQQYIRAPEWFQEMFAPDEDYKGKFDDLFGHGPNPQSFNLWVRDVKRGKKGTSAQSGELKASEEGIENYEYPEKHHGSPMNNVPRLHRDRTPRQKNIISHFEQKDSGGHYLYGGLESPEGIHENPKGKNPGDLWSISTKPSSISVCPKCETVFPRLIKICPNCKVEGIVGHFAPYPKALCISPIKASSRVGDVILDPFAGGGTTGVAAKRLGRQAIIIDCVRPYCVMAKYKLQRVEYQPEMEENV
jgi:DNA modification methylase